MAFDLSALNAKYRNLSEISYSENAWRLVRVSDSDAEKAYSSLLKCWSEKFLGDEHFADLRSSLRDAYVALRSVVGTVERIHEYLGDIQGELQASIDKTHNYLSLHERELLRVAAMDFRVYANKDEYPLSIRTLLEGRDTRRTVSLVLNGHEHAKIAEEFSDSIGVFPSITRALANLNYKNQNHIIVVAAPDQNLPINQIRLLMVGGYAVKVTFIVPTWWSKSAAKYFNSQLWFGLDGDEAEYIKEIAEFPHKQVEESSASIINWDTSVPARKLSKRVEKYINAGPVECNLLLLKQGLVMPIEKDANRIAVIRQIKNEYGFELEYVSPKRAAEQHDVVFSFAQVSERSFIREQAEKFLGDDLPRIQVVQESWKRRLNELALQVGWSELDKRLAEAGVEKSHRVRWWAQDPNFIRPQTENDFQQLLVHLGFQGRFIADAFEATRQINHARDTAGSVARKALANSITEQIWSDLQRGNPSEVSLNDVGEASFIASKIEKFQQQSIFSGVLQVRRILGGE